MNGPMNKWLLELLIHDRNSWAAQTYDEVSRLVQYRWVVCNVCLILLNTRSSETSNTICNKQLYLLKIGLLSLIASANGDKPIALLLGTNSMQK
jgi:hypothetical protein